MPRNPAEPQNPADETTTTSGPAAASGAASSTTDPYVADGGPGFDPREAPPEAPAADVAPPPLMEWEEDQVRTWLRNGGDLAHASVGVGDLDWAMTQSDLDRIAPPLTRILNRFEPSRMVAAYSDPAAVAVGFGLYGWRSALERRAVLEARKTQEDDPVLRPMAAAPGWDEPPPAEVTVNTPRDYVPFAERLKRQEAQRGDVP